MNNLTNVDQMLKAVVLFEGLHAIKGDDPSWGVTVNNSKGNAFHLSNIVIGGSDIPEMDNITEIVVRTYISIGAMARFIYNPTPDIMDWGFNPIMYAYKQTLSKNNLNEDDFEMNYTHKYWDGMCVKLTENVVAYELRIHAIRKDIHGLS